MSYYLFRMLTNTHAFEADCTYRSDLDAVNAANELALDFESVEVWDRGRCVASVQKKART